MNINEAIESQIRLIGNAVGQLFTVSNSNVKLMSECFTISGLTETLRQMIVARDEGKTIW